MKHFTKTIFKVVPVLTLLFILGSCNSDDTPSPFTVNFENTTLGISGGTTTVTVVFSRPIDTDGSFGVDISSTNLSYGETEDYYTNPAAENGSVTIPYASGDQSVSFSIIAGSGLDLQDGQSLTFSFQDFDGNLQMGQITSVTVAFSEDFVASTGVIEIDGGGETFPNQAFIDLSKLNQSTIDKYSWDLGFYTAAGEYAVILNNSSYVMAQQIDATDIDAVTASDTLGFAANMTVSNYYNPDASLWIDDQSGELDATAFGTISTTDSENKVFIIKRDGDGRNWKKVRVLQDGDNYSIEHADIDATSHTTTSITKAVDYTFTHLDLDHGIVSAEPEVDSWDIQYGTYANRTFYGEYYLAIGYNDFITLNRAKVSAAMVMTETVAYDDFSSSDLSSVTMVDDNISIIGSSWRETYPELYLYDDRFYVLKDTEDNYYKLKFTRLTTSDGDRGYPEITFELITD